MRYCQCKICVATLSDSSYKSRAKDAWSAPSPLHVSLKSQRNKMVCLQNHRPSADRMPSTAMIAIQVRDAPLNLKPRKQLWSSASEKQRKKKLCLLLRPVRSSHNNSATQPCLMAMLPCLDLYRLLGLKMASTESTHATCFRPNVAVLQCQANAWRVCELSANPTCITPLSFKNADTSLYKAMETSS